MFLYLILLFSEILILFLLSRRVQRKLGEYFYLIMKNKKYAVYAMSVVFLPGTFVHEMSHFLMALSLLVPVGNMQLIPNIKNDTIELGSVSIAKTDFVRSFFISTAPLLMGVSLILTVVYCFLNFNWYESWWTVILVLYLIFTVSNTMFISKKDSQGIWGFVVFVILITILMILLGLNTAFSFNDNSEIVRIISKSILFLAVPVVLDVIILLVR